MACRAFHAQNLQLYHTLIILAANSMITQLHKLWILYFIATQYSSVIFRSLYYTADPV